MTNPKLSAVPGEPDDPFDPAALRVDSLADLGVEKRLLTVAAKRPKKDMFFRVHSGPEFTVNTLVLERETDMDRETYLVAASLRGLIAGELRPVRMFTCMSKRGVVFLWPARLPIEGGNENGNRWARSGLRVAEEAKKRWVRMYGDRESGGYQLLSAKGDFGEPQWPDKTLRDLMEIAFRDRLIDREDHPVILELNGEL